MANPQPDIFLKFSKELFMAKMRVRIGGVQNQVWEAIMFLTYGQSPPQKMAPWSNSKVQELTGLSKTYVSKAKVELLKMGMIVTKKGNYMPEAIEIEVDSEVSQAKQIVTKKGNSMVELVGINKNYDDWKLLPKKVTGNLLPKKVTIVTKKGNSEKPLPLKPREREELKDSPPSPPNFEPPQIQPPKPVVEPKKKRPKTDAITPEEVVELYHTTLTTLPEARLTPVLRKKINTRINESANKKKSEWWQWYFTGVGKSDFLMGRKKDWSASLTWLVGPENMTKVLNGEYSNRTAPTPNQLAVQKFLEATSNGTWG